MNDLLARFARDRRALRTRLRWWHEAQASAAKWPRLRGPADHARYCRHGVDLELHRLGLRPHPGVFVPAIRGSDAYREAVMAIPLGGVA